MTLPQSLHFSPWAWRELLGLLVLLAVTVLPVSLAAGLANARRSGMLWSALAVFGGGIVAQFVLGLAGATLLGAGLAFLAMCAVYALVLEISLVGAVGVAVVAFILQILIALGLSYLGLHLHGLPR